MCLAIIFLALFCIATTSHAQLQPYLNCTRYMDPCIVEKGEACCGYPFYDCISDGREPLCQSLSDFPELSAELMLRLREAKDRGDSDATAIQRGVYDLLGTTTKRSGGGNRNQSSRSGGNRSRTTSRSGGRQTTRRTTRRPAQRSSSN